MTVLVDNHEPMRQEDPLACAAGSGRGIWRSAFANPCRGREVTKLEEQGGCIILPLAASQHILENTLLPCRTHFMAYWSSISRRA
jgi:hypothetical protein